MFSERRRYGQNPEAITRAKENSFNAPLKWKSGRVFTCSWSDFFIIDADEWRDDAWSVIRRTSHLTYQLLTKRPALIERRLPKDWGDGYPNVWLGVSAEDQAAAFNRISVLRSIPAKRHFLSIEPLLGFVDLHPWLSGIERQDGAKIDWVIVGGESGSKARFCSLDWVRTVVVQCKGAYVPVFVKQLGANSDWRLTNEYVARTSGAAIECQHGYDCCPKCDAGSSRMKMRDRKGGDINEWPEDLRVREFPGD